MDDRDLTQPATPDTPVDPTPEPGPTTPAPADPVPGEPLPGRVDQEPQPDGEGGDGGEKYDGGEIPQVEAPLSDETPLEDSHLETPLPDQPVE
jgi:hypothetical protein